VSLAALPYTVLLLLLELAVGSQWALAAADLRRGVTAGFVKTGAGIVLAAAALLVWVAFTLSANEDVDGFRLAGGWLGPARASSAVFLALSVVHNWFGWREDRRRARWLAVAASCAGLAAVLFAAAMVAPPTWGYPGAALSLITGALGLGAVLMGMLLGHWYLVTSNLPERPLNELVLVLLAALALQAAVLVLNVAVPARGAPAVDSTLGGVADNPAVWLRVAVGLVFPMALAAMAWQSSRVRGMMAATGLLYIASGAVLSGQALAAGLLFATGVAL